MAALRELVAQFDIKIGGIGQLTSLNHQIDKTKGGLLGNIGLLSNLGTAIASAFAIRKVADFFKQQSELGQELQTNAAMLGLSTDELQKWQYATELSGVSAGMFSRSIEHLRHSIGQLGIEQDKMLQQSFAKLGVKTQDQTGKARALTDVLLDTADAFSKMNDQSERVAVARNIFGRAGAEILPLLQQGRAGIEKLTLEAQKNGLVLGQDWVKAARDAEIEEHKLEWSWRAAKATISQELFPTFRNFVDLVTRGVGWFKELSKHTTIVSSGLTGLSVLAGIKLFGALSRLMGFAKGGGILGNILGMGKLALIVAGLAVLYLAFDDFFALFTGKKSEIGDIMDQVSGKGTSTKFVDDLKNSWNGLVEAITGVKDAANDSSDIWDQWLSGLKILVTYILHVLAKAVDVIAKWWAVLAGGEFDTSKWKSLGDSIGNAFSAIFAQDQDYNATTSKGHIEASPEFQKKYHVDASGNPLRRAVSVTTQEAGQKPVTVQIKQEINVQSGDPKKIGDAVHQRTSDALAQNDLRHAYNAVKNRAPAVQ